MMKVLINAYAVCPGMGSEPGVGWHWTTEIAKHCEVFVITESEFKEKILTEVEKLPQKKNLHFFWNEVSPEVRKMCWNQGDWRFYRHYRKWQERTYKIAKHICEEKDIDILHQLNMIGFREPGFLWKLSKKKNIPFVWGPIDAKEKFPEGYLSDLPLKHRIFMQIKSLISILQLKYDSRVDRAARRATILIGASKESVESMRKYKNRNAILINETACTISPDSDSQETVEKFCDGIHILWCGKIEIRKQLALAIKTIGKLRKEGRKVTLHVAGSGNTAPYKSLAKSLEIEGNIQWYGAISHEEVQILMKKCHLFLFTSLAEGTSNVVLEAIQNRLPVICHDCCGMSAVVDNNIGRKIAVTNAEGSVDRFTAEIEELVDSPNELQRLSDNCSERRKALSWEKRAEQIVELYSRALSERKGKNV